MAKSKIIQDLTCDKHNLESVLKRLYVILNDLNDKELIEWMKKELYGYSVTDKKPEYRKVLFNIMGDYQTIGYGKVWTHKQKTLPTIGFTEEQIDGLKYGDMIEPIASILAMIKIYEDGKECTIPLPAEVYPLFEKGTNISVINAYKYLSKLQICDVINKLESKILDLLIYLEKKFGNLDAFDIEDYSITEKQVKQIGEDCKSIIFNDNRIQNFNLDKIKLKNVAVGEKAKVDNSKKKKINKNSNTGKGNNYVEKHTDIKTDITIQKTEKKKSWWKRLFVKKEQD